MGGLRSKGRMEKFSLKWNDFETNISRSFKKLRQEEDFYDVTLVSDDHVHISSHKLVLSSSSDFFKTILRKSTHPNPMIYLTGVNSKELDFVIDYIYDGEVQIFQEDLNKFLAIAKILKIEGLVEHPLNQNDQNLQSFSNLSFPKTEEEEVDEKPTADFLKVEFPGENESKEKRRRKRRPPVIVPVPVPAGVEDIISHKLSSQSNGCPSYRVIQRSIVGEEFSVRIVVVVITSVVPAEVLGCSGDQGKETQGEKEGPSHGGQTISPQRIAGVSLEPGSL